MTHPIRSARTLVWVNAPVYLAVGLLSLFAPEWLAGQLGISLTSPTALADFRAMYGGLSLGTGLTMLAALQRDAWLPAAVALIGLCSLELALARVYSWFVAGTPSELIFGFMGAELVCAAWALGCHRALGATNPGGAAALRTASA